jgi:hypothetical protein
VVNTVLGSCGVALGAALAQSQRTDSESEIRERSIERDQRFAVAGAEPTVRQAKAGDVTWSPAKKHTGENIGSTDMDCILVELKEQR